MSPATDEELDVVELLERQHREIKGLFSEVEMTTGDQRRRAFERLVRLMAVHETAEEEVVHPAARDAGIDEVVRARLQEEHDAKELLQRLDELGPDAEDFMADFRRLRQDVAEHAEHEELAEFPALRARHDRDRLKKMAAAVRAAEAIAPTHPHPGVESGAANVVIGAPTAIVDRVRDAVRKAMGRSTTGTSD
ncbi:hemerythrin domain-containing protein [Kutzneria sp. NPDC051319]|uniref:hemerythrin domain-containing protein n=1 Tax=Kutzneria sp. NPDC051319 TaxID=3155047 RepID=UPI00343ACBDB